MNYSATPLPNSVGMGVYEPLQHISMWEDSFKVDSSSDTGSPTIAEVDKRLESKLEDHSHGILGSLDKYDQRGNKSNDKVLRRLAQNREAARKSRLRKKAYVKQLESSRLKLLQIEQELERARQQGLFLGSNVLDTGHLGLSGTVNPGIAAFEMDYGHWIEEQNRLTRELRTALQAHISDIELRLLVESCKNHYNDLFRIKAAAAKADVFYLMSGLWRTPAERFFLWIGGFRPSELLKVLMPQLDPLTEQQLWGVTSLQQSCQQAEDALYQGILKLQQTVAEILASDLLRSGNYMPKMAASIEKLEALVSFVDQADHLRQETLRQMDRILTTRQAARGLLALGDFFHRFRALSSLWAARPHERT
ncbi:hypothetical protein Syun_013682 [Stephania yunnanensis]|uniref:Uncharacterized protein n=1 Tax=Stephania yunnanensis TaxID=152371 RepID=A0AAP0JI22_9MAGN